MTDRELDALVAEKVLGLEVRAVAAGARRKMRDGSTFGTWPHATYVVMGDIGEEGVPPYSTDIAAAWTVVEKLGDHWLLAFDGRYHVRRTSWVVHISETGECRYEAEPLASADTAPRAICKAALRAVGVEVPA